MKINITQKKLSIFIFVLSFLLIVTLLPGSLAASNVHEIYSFNDLLNAAELSRQSGYQDHTYILQSDITITSENQSTIENSSYKYLSFGSSDVPFAGTFDGNGYTISNLQYDKGVSGNKYDTGLISQTTTGAVIRNLTIADATVDAVYRGGIVVGYAEGTLIENVVVKDSHLSLSVADNILTLITDGGVRGGAIVGDATNSVLYNCESDNNFVNINNTSGVAALSGKTLTTGALVGISNSSTIEYSRVYGGTVKNYYDVAVGAVGGNSLYVGGIVGQMKSSSKVIDCFSTATLYYYCGTYVSVGAGNVGYLGGITGKMDGDTNEIYRSHYAGEATSRQYNAALVIPVIQDNVNISGITESYGGGAVVGAYFKPSANPGVTMKVLGDSNSTSAYGPLDDAKYVDMGYWESQGFDFLGVQKRNTAYNNDHYNKWVIDSSLNMPIHGKSLSATLDFAGAGQVTIGSTDLVSASVSTTNPYVFATQGMNIDESSANLSATENAGYKFIGWYKVPKVNAWQIDEDYTFFEDLFSKYNIVSSSATYSNVPVEDNNLFVAKYKARVLYHDISGSLINSGGTAKLAESDDDYYNYNDEILNVEPYVKPSNSAARLIGWTTIQSNEVGGGYSGITSTVLTNIKTQNEFYEAGDPIKKAMSLYPIYVDSISNINTVFEGNELDSSNNVSLRENVGEATVTAANNQILLNIVGANNGDLPDGYRFLGWYDENGHKVSKDIQYDISNIDLTTTHTYTAKLEYRVEYYVGTRYQDSSNNFNDSALYATKWMKYNEAFVSIPAPGFVRESITHWGIQHVGHGTTDSQVDAYSANVTEPVKVYSHNYFLGTGSQTAYDLVMDIDFPGSGSITDLTANTGAKLLFTPLNNRYHLLFWAIQRSNNQWSFVNNPAETGTLDSLAEYKGMAFVTADVGFYKKDNTSIVVQRRYNTDVFRDTDESYVYQYPYYQSSSSVSTKPKDGNDGDLTNPVNFERSYTASEMKVNGYAHLGYISSINVVPNSSEWNYIYDVPGDAYTTSDINKAIPYLMTGNEKVYETQDIYPVYAKYNITTTTNVDFTTLPSSVNAPSNPTYVVSQENATSQNIVISVDNNTSVINGDTKKYTVKELTVTVDGVETTLTANSNGDYDYEVIAGKNYVFTAKYIPYILLYHTSNSTQEVLVKDYGDNVDTSILPESNVVANSYLFVGWTTTSPATNTYHLFASNTDYTNSNIDIISSYSMVTESLELYPVYVAKGATVNSNIDSELNYYSISTSTIYELSRTSVDRFTLVINDDQVLNYYFDGWYTNYVNDSNPGTKVSSNSRYNLSTNEALSNTVYTAVYKRIYRLNYYGTDGNILETVYVLEGMPRSFLGIEYDPNNNPIETPYDSDVFIELQQSLNQNERLLEWQWVDGNTIIAWEDFAYDTITSDMNLYPIIQRITATNSSNNAIDLTNSNVMDVSGDIDDVVAKFTAIYGYPTITFNVSNLKFKNGGVDTEAVSNVNIEVYKNTTDANYIAAGQTDSYGNLLLDLTDVINVSVTNSDSRTAPLIFDVINMNNPNVILRQLVITPGSSVDVRLPYGQYKIIEDHNWAWRYSNMYQTFNLNNQNTPSVSFNNQAVNAKWFDNTARNKNIY